MLTVNPNEVRNLVIFCVVYQNQQRGFLTNPFWLIKTIFEEGELDEKVVVWKFITTTQRVAIAGKTQGVEVNC